MQVQAGSDSSNWHDQTFCGWLLLCVESVVNGRIAYAFVLEPLDSISKSPRKMLQALAHPSDSPSRSVGLNLSESLRRHPPSLVFNRYGDGFFFSLNANRCGFAFPGDDGYSSNSLAQVGI
jgi:hypothetical protein